MKDRRGRPLDVLMLAAMADPRPPRVRCDVKRPAMSGSSTGLSMTTHFHATPEE
jgi:hypothetical protein